MSINGKLLKDLIPIAKVFASLVVGIFAAQTVLTNAVEKKIAEAFQLHMQQFTEQMIGIKRDLSEQLASVKSLKTYQEEDKIDRVNSLIKVNNIEFFLKSRFPEFIKPEEIQFKSPH